ncbi:hypothetical protein L2E82_00922 [Cichorium intybus]|uniref:Uncharacterized protein n=1 Tax=Cichorium intybus TaxID=13427 RepID=A0ACB9GYP2_CICIN|nr:hypothetical protein L2E82_00922 [Cichorium intybus]
MMANRAWTTRLQNSIRSLVPVFDHNLVYNVLHSVRNPDHALRFFRWVERSGLSNTTEKHITKTSIFWVKLQISITLDAFCSIFPKKGLEWDEDLFIVMIDGYGKIGIVQESVKIFMSIEKLRAPIIIKLYDTLQPLNLLLMERDLLSICSTIDVLKLS